MPYVLQERRPALNKVVDELVKIDLEEGYITSFLYRLTTELGGDAVTYELPLTPAIKAAKAAKVKPNGDINYVLFKYCKYHVKPSYNNYKNFMGEIYAAAEHTSREYKDEFRESAEWIRIKILTPYEEKAIERNGDV